MVIETFVFHLCLHKKFYVIIMDCITYNLIDSGRCILRQSCDYGKEICKEEEGVGVGSSGREVQEAGERVTRMHYTPV